MMSNWYPTVPGGFLHDGASITKLRYRRRFLQEGGGALHWCYESVLVPILTET